MLEMYVSGVSTRKVSKIVEELCGKSVSKSFVSSLTEQLEPMVNEWQNRLLSEKNYPYLMTDVLYIKVREENRVLSKSCHIAIGITKDGDREIIGFMIQSGDPKGDGTGGESIWKKGFAVEPTPFLYNIRGALAMANTGAKNSNGSQFYIVQNKDDQSKQLGNAGYPKPIIDAYKKGGYPAGDTKYTVFGQVVKGMDVVDTIGNLEVDDNSKPKENVTVNSVEVVKDYKFK